VERRDWYLRLLDLLRIRSRTIDDIVRQAGPYFLDEIEYDPVAVAKNWKDPPKQLACSGHSGSSRQGNRVADGAARDSPPDPR